jgi:SAM-dependent methyltransferase
MRLALGEFSFKVDSRSRAELPAHSQDAVYVVTGAMSDPTYISNKVESDPKEVFREALRVIKPGGKLIVGSIGDWKGRWGLSEKSLAVAVMEDVLQEDAWKGYSLSWGMDLEDSHTLGPVTVYKVNFSDAQDNAEAGQMKDFVLEGLGDKEAREAFNHAFDKLISLPEHEFALSLLSFLGEVEGYLIFNKESPLLSDFVIGVQEDMSRKKDVFNKKGDGVSEGRVEKIIRMVSDIFDHQIKINLTPGQSPVDGGIDLKAKSLNLETTGDNAEFKLPENLNGVDFDHMEGLTPVIMNITPIMDMPAFLGLANPQ